MKTQTALVSLFAVALLLSLGQVAKSDIPFVISYFDGPDTVPVTGPGYQQVVDVNINVVNLFNGVNMELAQAYGLRGMVDYEGNISNDSYATIDAKVSDLVNLYDQYPALLGYRLRDEPHADDFDKLAYANQKLQQLDPDPDHIPWVNLFPSYASSSQLGTPTYDQYVSDFMTIVQPKVLCYDNYSFENNNHFSNMETIRHYGDLHDVPYWYIFLSAPHNSNRDPTEGELRWQMYTALTYGYKGLLYFTYTTQDRPDYSGVGDALIRVDGTESPKYYIAQEINAEIQTLGTVLSQLTSREVYHSSPVPTGGNGLASDYVESMSGGQMVLGELEDASNRTYLFFTNREYGTNRTFTAQLDADINGVGRVDKDTGRLVFVDTPGHALSLPLAAGDGELYKVLLDITDASVPDSLLATVQSGTKIDVSWDPSADSESGIDYYCVYRDDVEIGTSTEASYSDTGLLPDTSYSYRISAVNGEGLESGKSDAVSGLAEVKVTLGVVDNGCPDTGLHRYTLTATGPGITTLSKFAIDGEVHQVFDSGTPSEWLGDGSASESETTDSHVIFGDLRFPDLGGETWPGPGEQPDKFTEETITGGGDVGMGTLNNHDVGTGFSDNYMKLGTPPGKDTVELMQLVVADGEGFSVDLELLTSTDYDPETGEVTVTVHDDLTFSLGGSEGVTLALIDEGCPETGLHRYTLTATGIGITTLSEFTIDGEVHQVFDSGTPSEWLGDGSASESETTDSHVIFGDLRLPDLGGESWDYENYPEGPPDKFTEETITGDGDVGMGTLNNYDDSTGFSDAYMALGEPGDFVDTVELMQLVVEDGKGLDVALKLLTATDRDPVTGEMTVTAYYLDVSLPTLTPGDANGDGKVDSTDVSILAQHWLQASSTICWADGDFNKDGAVNDIAAAILAANWQTQPANVPEPSTLVLLAGMLLVGLLLRK